MPNSSVAYDPVADIGAKFTMMRNAAAIKLYVEQHGDTVAGRKIEIILRDDAGVADNARRIIQEMIVNERVGLVGIGITPTSLAIAPLVTEARIPTLVLSSGASVTVTKSPYMVRAGFVIAQQSWIMAEWAAKTAANARSHWSTIGRRGLKRRPPSKRVLSRTLQRQVQFSLGRSLSSIGTLASRRMAQCVREDGNNGAHAGTLCSVSHHATIG